jgi:hypothetical protein
MQNSETNSANSANQLPDTSINDNNPTRTRANRRIDAATISEIARLCARQLSESEACRKIGIKPQAWFSWKSRHNRSEKFAALLEEFRAGRIDSLITKIEKSADGIGLKQPDWRAAAALLKFADLKRFGDSPPSIELHNHAPTLTDEQYARIEDSIRARLQIESKPAPKQIQDAVVISHESNPS